MHFIDEAKIFLKSGKGGDGCASFRREAHVPRGGPDGGDGGRGGNVIFKAIQGLNTLIDFRYTQHFKAEKGAGGQGQNRFGKSGKDLIIEIPVGTQVILDDSDIVIMDATQVGQEMLALKGGDGGMGNINFKTSTNQAPRRATKGFPAEEMTVWLKLKLLSNVGLVGLPNAGKSTFLSVVTSAKPKIANYPFTTLKPQLGVVYIDGEEFVMADIPGLIKGAHEGHGLGDRFLKHIERCEIILHLIDVNDLDVVENYHTIRHELNEYSDKLAQKHEIIALSKCDTIDDEMSEEIRQNLEENIGKKVYILSSISKVGTEHILRDIQKLRKEIKGNEDESE